MALHLFLDESFFYFILWEEVQPLENLIDPLNYKYHHAGKTFFRRFNDFPRQFRWC